MRDTYGSFDVSPPSYSPPAPEVQVTRVEETGIPYEKQTTITAPAPEKPSLSIYDYQ